MRHAALESYLARNQLASGEAREDDAVVLVLDESFRVYCRPAPRGELALTSRLAELPEDAAGADALLERSLHFAGERLDVGAESVSLSEDKRTLLLQQNVPADAGSEAFERALEDFVNAIDAWRRCLGVL